MSDFLKHECGIAMIRLRKPLAYYRQKYGSALHGFNQLFMLMEKQHNRGQDGAGIGCVKIGMPLGEPYMFRERSTSGNAMVEIFERQINTYNDAVASGRIDPGDVETIKKHFDFGGEVIMGHLRYGTSGNYDIGCCHPYFRQSNWTTRNLMVMGNFNMANTDELNQVLIKRGQHPIFSTDTQTVLEELGFHLDEQHTEIYREMRDRGVPGDEMPDLIANRLDLGRMLRGAAVNWDGGYAIAGMIGTGDAFVIRDPKGIRPCHWFANDDFIAVASERVPLQTAFDLETDEVNELQPGSALILDHDGNFHIEEILPPSGKTSCSFERIYFSRGNDADIYKERKALGAALVPQVIKAIDGDLIDSVFSFIPNTAEIAYYGMMEGLRLERRHQVCDQLLEAHRNGSMNEDLIKDLILHNWPRAEKVAHKDIKLRTFISQEKSRTKLASHVYDISYDVVQPNDHLVVVDDSIVRGTTLRQSIIKILARTKPRSIVIASTAPQIRYPDCYGIDMSELGKFIAFQAAIALLHKHNRGGILEEVYKLCKRDENRRDGDIENHVKRIYAPFSEEEISAEISRIVTPSIPGWHGPVKVVFQSIANLQNALPNSRGDWYFTGNYPTPGGMATVNRSFIRYYEQADGRTY